MNQAFEAERTGGVGFNRLGLCTVEWLGLPTNVPVHLQPCCSSITTILWPIYVQQIQQQDIDVKSRVYGISHDYGQFLTKNTINKVKLMATPSTIVGCAQTYYHPHEIRQYVFLSMPAGDLVPAVTDYEGDA